MEEYTESDEVKGSLASGGVGGSGGVSGIEGAADEFAAGAQPAKPEAMQEAPADAGIDSQSPSAPTAMDADGAFEKNREDATNEDVVDEDSPIFLTAVSHTTESDAAAGGDVSGDEVLGGADAAEDVAQVKAEASAIAPAGSTTKNDHVDGKVGQNTKACAGGDVSADPNGEVMEKQNEDPVVMEPNTSNVAPEEDAAKDTNNGKTTMELDNKGTGGSAADEANGKRESPTDAADQMEVDGADGADDDRNQSNLTSAEDAKRQTTVTEMSGESEEDPCADLVEDDSVTINVASNVKEPTISELTEDDALRALAKMPLPTEQATRKTPLGKSACALDGCDKQEQGRRNHFFCKKHHRMWREANRKIKPSRGRATSASTAAIAAVTTAAATSTHRASINISKRSTRKRKEYDQVVAVDNTGEVVSEEVPMRSRKRERRARNVGKTTQDQPMESGNDKHLQAALRLSIEEKVKASPRKAGAVAASAVLHTAKKRRSTRSRGSADRPSLVNQVVRLTDEGAEEMGASRFIGEVDPHLYFVLNYNDKNDKCDLVPMRIDGQFNARDSNKFPQSKGRDKWILYSEKECEGQMWKVSGRMLEIVLATTIANTADADDEQWDVHDDEVGKLVRDNGQESKSAAKFSHKQSVYALEDDDIFYKSKVKKRRYSKENYRWEYELHFVGWGAKYDRWVPEQDIVKELPPGEAAGPIPNSSSENKKKASTPESLASDTTNHQTGGGSSASTGTSIYAKCSSSNDTGSPNNHNSADAEEMLQVERILGRRWNTQSRQIEFLTVWKGFEDDPSEYTWEPEGNFSIRSLAIFKQMWGKTNDPPLDGKEEMLNERDIKKLRELESKSTNTSGNKAASSTHASTEANSSTSLSSAPSSSVRRSTRARTTAPDLTESGGKVGKKDEVDSTDTKSSRSGIGPDVSPSRGASGVVWTPVNECILLLTALEHPDDLVSKGPGLWMVTKSEWLFEGAFPKTDRQVRIHFEEMIRRKCDRLADHSAVNYARHILNFALASAPPSAQAKNLALVAAGWYRIAGGGGLDCSKAAWHPPLLDFNVSYCRYSEAQTKKLAVTLDAAWEEHEKKIRDAIEEAWVPTTEQTESADNEEMIVEAIEDEDVVAKEKEGDEDEMEAVTHKALTNTDAKKEITVGIAPKKLESDERADWAKYGSLMKERKRIVEDGDPRPSLTCRWCGARPFDLDCYDSKSFDQIWEYREVPATCKACKYLEELGWKMNWIVKMYCPSKRRTQNRKGQGAIKVIPPDGKQIESVKEFLRISTSIVSEEFSKNHALNTPSTLAADKNGKEKNTKRSSKVVPSIPTIAVDEPKEKSEDKGIEEIDNSGGEAPTPSRRLRPTTKFIKPALPTFDDLLTLERGLVTILEFDDLHVWNACYGTNSTVALCTLRSLATGKLPILVQSETPFFRSRDELNVMGRKGGAPPTRFLGVSRIVKSDRAISEDGRHYTGKFGVEFPLFDMKVDPLVPKSATITGRTVLIRNDLTEDVAGRLYAFMFRLLYGTAVVERMLQKTNSLAENASLVQDTLRAFGANEEDEAASNL